MSSCQMTIMILIITGYIGQGIGKSVRKIGKKCDFVSEKCDFWQKVRKSAILAQKCENLDFGQMVHNNAIFAKIVWLGAIFWQKCEIAPPHFSTALIGIILKRWTLS